MKKILAMAAVLVAMAVVGTAAPIPVCGNLGSVMGPVLANGCTYDGLTFSNFSVINTQSGVGTAEIDLFGASLNGNDITLSFNPNLGQNALGNQITDLAFTFTVSGPLTGADGATSITNANINETICSNAATICTNANTLFAAQISSGQSADCQGNTKSGTTSICNFGSGVNAAYVSKDISIQSPTSGSLSLFTQSFYTGVPEPMTLSMMGVGLLGLGLISRRRKQS